jgi:hypothetical protein
MSFLKKLFGLGDGAAGEPGKPAVAETQEHEGFTIAATPFENAGRWQLSGIISKDIDGVRKEHSFIRADAFATRDEAVSMVFFKARQIIELQGDSFLR